MPYLPIPGVLLAALWAEGAQADLRVSSRLVLVPVTVRDGVDQPIRHLKRDQFRVAEDGQSRPIVTFSEEEGPVSVGIVFDASRSMENRLDASRQAINRLFDHRMDGDEYFAVAFNDSPFRVCGFTPDHSRVNDALSRIGAKGWTSLYDGIWEAARQMKQAAHPRRALLVLSDGEDNFSRLSKSELQLYLREAGVMVFGIGLDMSGLGAWRGRALRQVAEDTGGWFRSVANTDELAQAMTEMSRALRSVYVLGIQPADNAPAGKFRRIKVAVDGAKGAHPWRVSWRSGYVP